ncbi:MAG: hypothetical protein EOP46_19150 [Sphingobacteriaceae bacterium]|nr:MAG: hypothetical protein EOP46_19150 [Sphingobacteriaceae bacterium]
MRNIKLSAFLLLFAVEPALAQVPQPFDPAQLKITWDIKERNYKQGYSTLSTVTLVNTGSKTLPTTPRVSILFLIATHLKAFLSM